MARDVAACIPKQVMAARVRHEVEIVAGADDETTFEICATAERLNALAGDPRR